jgi:ATP-binding cassette subfamily F protein uup
MEDTAKSAARASAPAAAKAEPSPRSNGLSFTEKKRLDDLPGVIAKLEAEIGKLSELLSDPELFTREPVKFRKASDALTERQAALEAAETEWLELAERA